ncbi:MAG: hypothetical protein ACE367_07085 [Acidimicrobiales bacterium]
MSDRDTSAGRDEGERIDADHPRPGRRTPYRTGQGHGDPAVGDTAPRSGLTGDDVAAGDEGEHDHGGSAHADEGDPDDVDRYRDSPGAGLVRDDEIIPEPNEPG